MRIFQTFVLPDKLVSKFKLSFAAANFSRNLISGKIFDKVYSLLPITVSGALGNMTEPEYELVYSKLRLKNGIVSKLSIFAEQWSIFRRIKGGDSLWMYNLNIMNALLFILLKLFKPSVKLNVIILDFTPPKNWRSQNYWYRKLINSADGTICLSNSDFFSLKNTCTLPGIVPQNISSSPSIVNPKKIFLLSGVISETISMTAEILEAFKNHPECILHITGKVLEKEDMIRDYANKYPNIIYHQTLSFDEYIGLLHNITFQLSTRNPNELENQCNFPSKIIEALLHNRIVVSTIEYPQLHGINYLKIDSNNLSDSLGRIAKMGNAELLKNANQEVLVREAFNTNVWETNIQNIENQER